MAAPVQISAVANSTGAANCSPSLTGVTAGNLLVLTLSWAQQTNNTPPTISGWTAAENPAGQSFIGGLAFLGSCIFYKENASSGSITATIVPDAGSTNAAISAYISEFTSTVTSGSLDSAHTNSAGNSATAGGSGTTGATAGADRVIVTSLTVGDETGATHANLGISVPASSGYSDIGSVQNTTTGFIGLQASYKTVTATGTQTASWTWIDSSGYQATIAAFDVGTPPPPPASVGKAFRYKGVKTTSASSRNGIGKYSNGLNTSSPFTPKQSKIVPPIFVNQFFDTSTGGGTTYTFAVSGGIVFSGGITRMTKTRVQIPSGGITFSGGITRMTKTKVFPASGGITFAGAPAILHTRTFLPSGGITFSGTNLPLHVKTYQPTGGITFGGTADQIHIKVYAPSGAIVFSGTAPISTGGASTYTITPSGGITFAGSAPTEHTKVYIPSGNISFSGTNGMVKVKVVLPSGNITFTGNATITFIPDGSGAIISTRLPMTGAGTS